MSYEMGDREELEQRELKARQERRDAGCPFCHLLHDYERSNCDGHDGTKTFRIRNRGPITDEERLSR